MWYTTIMNTKQFIQTVASQDINGYSDAAQAIKSDWLKTGRSICCKLAKALGLERGSFDVRVNPAGIAVSGDIHLHGEFVYVTLEQSSMGNMFYWRFCAGRKDYCGKQNRWESFEVLNDLDTFAKKILSVENRT